MVDKDKRFAGRSVAVLSSFSRNLKGLVVVDEGCSEYTQCFYDYCYRLTTKFYLSKKCNTIGDGVKCKRTKFLDKYAISKCLRG